MGFSGAGGEGNKGFAAAASWCTEVSCCPGEVELESKGREAAAAKGKNRRVEVPRPPLVRTSRGRVQVLPSRFNDSILDNWKKESKPSLQDFLFDDDFDCKKEKFSFRTPKTHSEIVKTQRNDDKFGYKSRKFSTLYEEEGEEVGGLGIKHFDIRKYSSSRSSLTSLHEQLIEDEKRPLVKIEELNDLMSIETSLMENGERKNGFVGWMTLFQVI
ncbi:hypothetical protein L1049_019620 [Liquidambar formosana]|uniref:Uncharacterized protein n=1 Tax=Liquidambar formosana TaxID=63359 RepID=A0AAP0X5E5_LIQFO